MLQKQQMFLLNRVNRDKDTGALGQVLTEPGARFSVTEARAACLSLLKPEETLSGRTANNFEKASITDEPG